VLSDKVPSRSRALPDEDVARPRERFVKSEDLTTVRGDLWKTTAQLSSSASKLTEAIYVMFNSMRQLPEDEVRHT